MKNWSSNWGSSNKESSTTAIMFRNENALAREGVFFTLRCESTLFLCRLLSWRFLGCGLLRRRRRRFLKHVLNDLI